MVYEDESSNGNFESAGMFQISAYADKNKAFIHKDKRISIDYPSETYGEYDFFFFEQSNNDSIISGNWNKLTTNVPYEISKENIIDSFKINFDTNSYPELEELHSINWKLAKPYDNPNDRKNKWVLEQKWTSVNISKPKYGFGRTIFSAKIDTSAKAPYEQSFLVKVLRDINRIITINRHKAQIWDSTGAKIFEVKNLRTPKYGGSWYEVLNDSIFNFKCKDGDYIYNHHGKLLCKLPETEQISFAKKANKIYYTTEDKSTLFVAKINGKGVKKIHYDSEKFPDEDFIVNSNDEIIINTGKKIAVYSSKGKLINQKIGVYRELNKLNDKTVEMRTNSNTLQIWDYINNNEIIPDSSKLNFKNEYIYTFPLEDTNYIIARYPNNSDSSAIINYKTGEIIQLGFIAGVDNNKIEPNIISGYNRKDSMFYVYDIEKRKSIIEIPNVSVRFKANSFYHYISQNKKYIIVNSSKIHLYDIYGNLIKDLQQFDSLTTYANFIKDKLYTMSENGVFRLLNVKGEEVSNKKIVKTYYNVLYKGKRWLSGLDILDRKTKLYDFEGNLLFNFRNTLISGFIDSTTIVCINHEKKCLYKKLFLRENNVYQLNLNTPKQEFITYVYLNEEDLNKISKYYKIKDRKAQIETQRKQAENELTRRFAINKFGIYNWDKLISQDNTLSLRASFDFGISIDNYDIVVYLITQTNGSAVVKFDKNNWDKFSFNPNLTNKLVAVLPGNRIAVFNSEDFKSINLSKIKKTKYHEFKMNILEQPISKISDLDKLLN